MLEINEKVEKDKWNEFVIINGGSFLQSFEWGEFQVDSGEKVLRFIISENNSILTQVQVIKKVFPFLGKSFFYIPFGPVFKQGIKHEKKRNIFKFFLDYITKVDKQVLFLKVEPIDSLFEEKEFNEPLKRIQPQQTLTLSLKQDEDEILKNFADKTRYNINLSKRKGVEISFQDQYSPEFYNLIKKTSKRDGFQEFEEKHYKKLFDFNSKDFKVKLCLANYNNRIIGAGILVMFGGKGQCIHSGSDWEYRSLKAPNLLQWERIKFFKENRCKEYDFWGIDEKKWPGLTSFKKGFGGKKLIYPEGRDIVFQKTWYWIYKILRGFKKIIFR